MNKLKLEYVPLAKIHPYANNPRINDAAVPKVAESIKRFGFNVPIVVDAKNQIVCGHTRYKAALSLKMDAAPCVRVDALSPKQVAAYRLADNKTAEAATWDLDKLAAELMPLGDLKMEDFGFDAEATANDDKETMPDEVTPGQQYDCIVHCKDEKDLQKLFERLSGEGFKCSISTL